MSIKHPDCKESIYPDERQAIIQKGGESFKLHARVSRFRNLFCKRLTIY